MSTLTEGNASEGTSGSEGQGSEGTPPAPPATPPAPAGEKTLPQAEVDRIVQGRVAEATRKAEKAIADKLGVDPEEAAKLLKAQREAADKDKGEAEKAREALAKAEQRAADAEAKAAAAEHSTKVREALRTAEVAADRVSRASQSLLADVEVGATDDEIKTAVEALKKEIPEWFGSTKPATAPGSDTGGAPAKGGKNEDAMQKGFERGKETKAAGYPLLEKELSS